MNDEERARLIEALNRNSRIWDQARSVLQGGLMELGITRTPRVYQLPGPGWRHIHNTLGASPNMARTDSAGNEFTTEAPELRTATAPRGAAKVTAQAWFEDKVVRAIRAEGHCTEALRIMDRAFGKPLDEVGVYDVRGSYGSGYGSKTSGKLYPAYLDSDGADCWGNVWRDKDGFDRKGLDVDGRDKDGFDKDGRDKDGFDREGKDANGISKDDPARFRYNPQGYDAEGYNREGLDQYGWNREGKNRRGEDRPATLFAFDTAGYDVDGYNVDGYSRGGEYNEERRMAYRRATRGSGMPRDSRVAF